MKKPLDQYIDILGEEKVEWLKQIHAVDISKFQLMSATTNHLFSLDFVKNTSLVALQAMYEQNKKAVPIQSEGRKHHSFEIFRRNKSGDLHRTSGGEEEKVILPCNTLIRETRIREYDDGTVTGETIEFYWE